MILPHRGGTRQLCAHCCIREGATQRLLDVASIAEEEWPKRMTRLRDWVIWRLVYAGNGALPSTFCVHASLHLHLAPDTEQPDPDSKEQGFRTLCPAQALSPCAGWWVRGAALG